MKCNREEKIYYLMDESVNFICGDSNDSSFSGYIKDLSSKLRNKSVEYM